MVNAVTRQEETLHRIRGSRCHFMDWFCYKDYDIQLRFDYDGNPNEPPTLDADIKIAKTGELVKHGPWHHTEAKWDAALNMNMYDFKYEALLLRFSTVTTRATDITFDVLVGKPQGT